MTDKMNDKKKIKIYMGITTIGNVVDSQAYALRDLLETYGDYVEFVYPPVCTRRIFHDFARNMVVEEFLESNCDVLWFLDSDITPAAHVLDLIALHWDKWSISGATYPVFMNPMGQGSEVVYTAYKMNDKTGNLAVADVPTEGTALIDGLATGCLFIKREVFSKLTKPYFEFKYDSLSRELKEGEDLGFCRKANEAGYKFFTDYSMVCKHQKGVDLLDVNNYAIMYANRAINQYTRNTQDMTRAAVKEAYQIGYEKALKDVSAQVQKTQKPSSTLWTP